HGQHEHHTLLDPATHLAVLDTFGALEPLAAPVAIAFRDSRSLGEELLRLKQASADRQSKQELVAFQLAELDRAAPAPGEDDQLREAPVVLASAERIEPLVAGN